VAEFTALSGYKIVQKKGKTKNMKQRLKIQGMHCTSCAMNIDGALEDLPGVQEASTSYARGQLDVSFEPAQVTLEQIIATIEEEGFTAQVETGNGTAEKATLGDRVKSMFSSWRK